MSYVMTQKGQIQFLEEKMEFAQQGIRDLEKTVVENKLGH